jgi:hypothetical protein
MKIVQQLEEQGEIRSAIAFLSLFKRIQSEKLNHGLLWKPFWEYLTVTSKAKLAS